MADRKCETCRWWDSERWPHKDERGECRRYPPILKCDIYGDDLGSEWPTIGMDGWCGEWTAREAKP